MSFSKQRGVAHPELTAAAGGATTITSAAVSFMNGLDPYLAFGAKFIAVAVGLATFTFYVLSIIEKIKTLRAKRK
jgi:hypothetical protein